MSATPIVTQPSSIPTDIAKITGPLLFGPILNWALYGVICVQIYVYSYNFPKDKPIVKFIAYFAFVAETVQTVLTGTDVYYWFVKGFGNVERLAESHLTDVDIAIIHAIVAPVIKGYFCFRIWTLSKRSLNVCIVIALLTLGSTVGAAWAGIAVLTSASGKISETPIATIYLWAFSSVSSDILITVAMMLLLTRARCGGGQFSNFVVVRLVRLTIETNAVTTAVAIATVVLFAGFPDNMYFMIPAGIAGKLYTNTLFVSLNNRIYFRDHRSSVIHVMSDCIVESDQNHHHLSQTRFAAHSTTLGESYISHTIDLEKGNSDAVSNISLDPSHPK